MTSGVNTEMDKLQSIKQGKKLSTQQEESMLQNGINNDDFVLHLLNKYKIPVTKENYIGLAYPEGLPSDFDESSLPEQVRK